MDSMRKPNPVVKASLLNQASDSGREMPSAAPRHTCILLECQEQTCLSRIEAGASGLGGCCTWQGIERIHHRKLKRGVVKTRAGQVKAPGRTQTGNSVVSVSLTCSRLDRCWGGAPARSPLVALTATLPLSGMPCRKLSADRSTMPFRTIKYINI